jgi:hypothetical protein
LRGRKPKTAAQQISEGDPAKRGVHKLQNRLDAEPNLTFAVHGHFRRASQRILFAFNGGIPETGQMKTLPLF